MSRKPALFVIGSYGRGNLGDDAFLLAICKLVTKHKIIINAADDAALPSVVAKRVTSVSTNGLKDIKLKLLYFIRCKYIIYGGGDVWVDLHKDRFKRKSLWKMIIVNLVSRGCGKKLIYVSTGAGDISGFSLFLAKCTALLANDIIYRDQRSRDLISVNGMVLSDITCVFATRLPKHIDVNMMHKIGFTVTYNIDNPEFNFDRIITEIKYLISKMDYEQTKITIYPMLISSTLTNDDLWASKQLKNKLKGYNVKLFTNRDPVAFMEDVNKIDLMISMRLHGSILALWSQTAVLGISYRPKVKEFFREHASEKLAVEYNDIDMLDTIIKDLKDGQYSLNYKDGYIKGLKSKRVYEEFFSKL